MSKGSGKKGRAEMRVDTNWCNASSTSETHRRFCKEVLNRAKKQRKAFFCHLDRSAHHQAGDLYDYFSGALNGGVGGHSSTTSLARACSSTSAASAASYRRGGGTAGQTDAGAGATLERDEKAISRELNAFQQARDAGQIPNARGWELSQTVQRGGMKGDDRAFLDMSWRTRGGTASASGAEGGGAAPSWRGEVGTPGEEDHGGTSIERSPGLPPPTRDESLGAVLEIGSGNFSFAQAYVAARRFQGL